MNTKASNIHGANIASQNQEAGETAPDKADA